MWTVDGSQGEGGGQVVRIACGIAAALGEEVVVTNVRAGRDDPGLKPQHVAALKGLEALTGGELEGAAVGSREVRFQPARVASGTVEVAVGTAGSITMVLQALLPACLAADGPVRLDVSGGTDVKWSPPWDHLAEVLLPHLRAMGLEVECRLHRRGHYPKGGGRVSVAVHPGRPTAPDYAPPDPSAPAGGRARVEGRLHLTDLPDHIADRMEAAARKVLVESGVDRDAVRIEVDGTPGTPGCGLVLWTPEHPRLGADALGERGVPAEEVGKAAAGALTAELDAGRAAPEGAVSVDVRTADQLLPYLALADAPSAFTVRKATGHLRTLAGLLEDLGVARVTVEETEPVGVEVRPEGVF